MQPKIEVIGDVNKCLPYLKWAKNQWALREGSWQKQLDTCIIYFKRNADYGYILFQTFGTKGLVTNPHNATNLQFVLDATKDPLWIMDRDGWPPLEPNNPDQDKEIQVGNYYVLDKDDNAYSIKVPHHNLASDIGSSVKGYTQYSWTTNVSTEDVYTCYSEYVYSEGEAVFAGTMAPPEAAFKYSLIVGMGLDDKDVLHIAQLVQVPKDYGYWKIEKDGSNLGTFFGTFAAASEKGAATLIWKNESDDKRWFIEFLTCDNGLDSELVTNLNIYRREDGSRYLNKQWFFKDGEWFQYTSSLPAKFKFDGIQEEGGLKKTRYSQVLDAALVNSKPVVASHFANSLSGVVGNYEEIYLNAYKIPSWSVVFTPSANWGQDNSYVDVYITGSVDVHGNPCFGSLTVSTTLEGATVSIVEPYEHYRLTLGNRCIPNKSNMDVTGDFIVSSSLLGEEKASLTYHTKVAAWYTHSSQTATFTAPGGCGSETLYSTEYDGNFKTNTYRCGSAYMSFEEDVQYTACRSCQPNYTLGGANYTMDADSYTRPDSRWLGSVLSFSVLYRMATGPYDGSGCSSYGWGFTGAADCPCCEWLIYGAPSIQRNYWIVFTRWIKYEWRCS